MKVLFLGYGKMGQALGNAWMENQLISHLVVVDPMIISDGKNYFKNQQDVPEQAFDLIILAVKPNMATTVLNNLNITMKEKACIISIMAGVETTTLENIINDKSIPVIRVMPNTPVLTKAGCCILYSSSHLEYSLRNKIEILFSAVGYSHWLNDENDLHAVTALSGSGPAYFHLFTEALAETGKKLGLSQQLSDALAKQTAYGTALLQNTEDSDLVQLRQNVTSPNGTTHAAIQAFEKDGALRNLVEQALTAALKRSIELSKI